MKKILISEEFENEEQAINGLILIAELVGRGFTSGFSPDWNLTEGENDEDE